MTVETDSFLHAKRRRLSHIMQKNTEGKYRTRVPHHSQHHPSVHEYVSLGMILRGLLHAAHGLDFREDLRQQATFMEKVQPPEWIWPGQNLQQFVANPLPADDVNLGGQVSNGLPGLRGDLKMKAAGEPEPP